MGTDDISPSEINAQGIIDIAKNDFEITFSKGWSFSNLMLLSIVLGKGNNWRKFHGVPMRRKYREKNFAN